MPQRLTRLRVKTSVYLSAAGRNLGKANSLGEIARIGVHAYFRIDRSEAHAKVCRDERAGGDINPITKASDLVLPDDIIAVECLAGVELQRGVLPTGDTSENRHES